MLRDYKDKAILSVRELRDGVDKLERIEGESLQSHNERRKLRLNRLRRNDNGSHKSKRTRK